MKKMTKTLTKAICNKGFSGNRTSLSFSTLGNWLNVFKRTNKLLFLFFLLLEITNPKPSMQTRGRRGLEKQFNCGEFATINHLLLTTN